MSTPVEHSWTVGDSSPSVAPALAVGDLSARDIWLDVSAAHGPNLAVNKTGDWILVSGREALRQSLLRRFITNPGEWATKPGYGVGARQFVKRRLTKGNRDELENRLRTQCLKDARVVKVEAVVVERGEADTLRIKVTVLWRGEDSRPLDVSLELN